MTMLHPSRPPEIPAHNDDAASAGQCSFWRSRTGLAAIGFLLIGASLLLFEHRLHVLGYLPFVLLLFCPLLHVFMHRGHGHGAHRHSARHADSRDISGGI